jgi:hypothetical protein
MISLLLFVQLQTEHKPGGRKAYFNEQTSFQKTNLFAATDQTDGKWASCYYPEIEAT